MSNRKFIVASGLERLRPLYDIAFPVDEGDCFEDLLAAIDRADEKRDGDLQNPTSDS